MVDFDLTTKYGIDRTKLMIRFIPIIEAKTEKAIDREINKMKSFLVQQIKRGITPQENIALLEGVRNYIISDSATNERMAAMKYLFNLDFIN
jgi:hypothetical protein